MHVTIAHLKKFNVQLTTSKRESKIILPEIFYLLIFAGAFITLEKLPVKYLMKICLIIYLVSSVSESNWYKINHHKLYRKTSESPLNSTFKAAQVFICFVL